MDINALKRYLPRVLAVGAIAAGIGALLLLAASIGNSAEFSRWLPWLLAVNILGVIVFGVMLARKLWQLYRALRDHVPGSRLTLRTVVMFGSLVLAPLAVVYLFSLDFINRGIDSWFRVEIKRGLNDAVVLSRGALDLRLHEQARRTDALGRSLGSLHGMILQQRIDEERREINADSIVIYSAGGQLQLLSAETPLMSPPLAKDAMLQAEAGHSYASLNPEVDGRYSIVTAAPISEAVGGGLRSRYLVVNYSVPMELATLADAVQRTSSQYADLSAVREPLKISFRLTLTLVVLLTALAALYGAMYSAQRLAQPVQDLIAGTRAVGKGDFGTQIPLPSRDEMGFLVYSFNDMTRKLRRTSEEAARSRAAVERERERLAIILSRLSTGVIVTDRDLTLRIANHSADEILGTQMAASLGGRLGGGAEPNSLLANFTAQLQQRLESGESEWREQVEIPGGGGERAMLWACTSLPDERDGGVVLVFEDITAVLAAQRQAAWGEVARRLAHEIKNPLTPIQLAAERLRHRLLPELSAEGAQLLERSTHTIVQQVDAMKQMVNAFSDYARAPDMHLTHFNLNQLVTEIVELYRLQAPAVDFRLNLQPNLPDLYADRGRVRQVVANLLTNGIDALQGADGAWLLLATQIRRSEDAEMAIISVSDNGPGFRTDLLGRVFDPYVTGKPRGTGLGLAIVKRIVDEHGGRIDARNRIEGGAIVDVSLPVSGIQRQDGRRERA